MLRPKIDKDILTIAWKKLEFELGRRLQQHGEGVFVSPHEALGVITEEYAELVAAVGANDGTVNELFDLAVAALFGAASMLQMEVL